MSERVASVCRVCAVGCGTIVELDGPRVVSINGDPDDPWSQGYTCSKGRAGGSFHHHPDRLDVPLVRRDGELVPCSWDDALDDIAARIAALVDEHGPDVVADYTGTGGPLDPSGYALAEGFMRNLGSHQRYSALSIDCPAKFLVPQLMAGVQLQFQPDLDARRAAARHRCQHGRLPRPRRDGAEPARPPPRPARPRRAPRRDRSPRARRAPATPTSTWRPGRAPTRSSSPTSSARRCGAAATTTFLRDVRRRRQPAAARRRRRARSTSATTAAIAGVPAADLRALDALVAGAGRVAIETGTGVMMNRHANLTEWLVWALAAVTGSLDRPGGVTFNPGSLRRFEDAVPGGRGDLGPRPASRPDLPRLVNGEMPCAVLADEIRAGHVRALLVRVGNPALAIAGQPALREVLGSLDLLVAIDVRPTETTAVATHVLPMTDHLERGDLLSGYLQAQPFLRYAPPVLAPVGERRPQWWVFAELARRLGHADVRQRPPRRRARRSRRRRRGHRRVDHGQRPAPVVRGARRAVRHPRRLGGAGLARAVAPAAAPRPGTGRARRPARRRPPGMPPTVRRGSS